MTPTFGSLFAGVGGFDLGLERAGWQCGFQVEWDTNCQAVLARHWPDVPRWGDVSDVDGATLPPVDLITFGSPCQDLSVAGKRAGLDGARSGLFFEAIRIIKEMRSATNNEFPRWAIWENVVGALSSNGGADFGAVLDAMADAGALVIEWAVLDARWLGVPQRRRRVFVVACFDPAIGCPDPLLPVAARSGWHPPTSDQAGSPAPATATGGFDSSGISPAVTAKWAKGADGPAGDECQNLVLATHTHTVSALTQGLGSGGPDAAHALAGWLVGVSERSGPGSTPADANGRATDDGYRRRDMGGRA